jgi:hypothetical protein
MDIGPSLKRWTRRFYAGTSGVNVSRAYMSNRFDSGKTLHGFSRLQRKLTGIGVADIPHRKTFRKDATMPLKPNGALCKVREQIIEDAASGLTLQFECDDGRMRLVLAGKALNLGNREILFDHEGREAGAGTLVGEFRRPSWLKGV